MLESYDDTLVPHIGETSPCIPEVHVFPRESDSFRVVLHGKKGLRGYKAEPVIAIECQTGTDALGCATWISIAESGLVSMLGALFMSFRTKMKDQENAASK